MSEPSETRRLLLLALAAGDGQEWTVTNGQPDNFTWHMAEVMFGRQADAVAGLEPFRRLSQQEKYNIESRRSLCEQSDRYKAERDEARYDRDQWKSAAEGLREQLDRMNN